MLPESWTYYNRAINTTFQLPWRISLLLAWLALLNLRCLTRRRQTHSHKCYLQNGEGRQDAEERWDGVCDNGVEFVRVQREDDHGMDVRIKARRIILEGFNGRYCAGLRLGGSGCVNGDFAGHVCGIDGRCGSMRRWRNMF